MIHRVSDRNHTLALKEIGILDAMNKRKEFKQDIIGDFETFKNF